MRALTYEISIPRFLLSKASFNKTEETSLLSSLHLKNVPAPELPDGSWVRLKVLAGGICGTDLSVLSYNTSLLMEPFSSFPAVLGHEIVAEVEKVGPEVKNVEVGHRVIVDPFISCRVRGFSDKDICPACASGQSGYCHRGAEKGLTIIGGRRISKGLTIGYHADLPGGWGETMLAHESQLYPVDQDLNDKQAVLIEPLSIALRAVLRMRSFLRDPVLVIGSGPIALGTVWALRALGYEGKLLAQTKRSNEGRLALLLGATASVKPGQHARNVLLDSGATAHKPLIGSEIFTGGGFPIIFDCVGSAESIDQSLRFAGDRGHVVMLGCAGSVRNLDLSFLWSRELTVHGFVGYGTEIFEGEDLHTFEITQKFMKKSLDILSLVVTHEFSLEDYQKAINTTRNKAQTGAIKAIFRPSRDFD